MSGKKSSRAKGLTAELSQNTGPSVGVEALFRRTPPQAMKRSSKPSRTKPIRKVQKKVDKKKAEESRRQETVQVKHTSEGDGKKVPTSGEDVRLSDNGGDRAPSVTDFRVVDFTLKVPAPMYDFISDYNSFVESMPDALREVIRGKMAKYGGIVDQMKTLREKARKMT